MGSRSCFSGLNMFKSFEPNTVEVVEVIEGDGATACACTTNSKAQWKSCICHSGPVFLSMWSLPLDIFHPREHSDIHQMPGLRHVQVKRCSTCCAQKNLSGIYGQWRFTMLSVSFNEVGKLDIFLIFPV